METQTKLFNIDKEIEGIKTYKVNFSGIFSINAKDEEELLEKAIDHFTQNVHSYIDFEEVEEDADGE